jgi:uncharacterized damage-inducible protein DinB
MEEPAKGSLAVAPGNISGTGSQFSANKEERKSANLAKPAIHPRKAPPVTKRLHLAWLSSSLGAIPKASIATEASMKVPIRSFLCLASVLSAGAVAMHAQTAGNSTDSTAPSYDMKGQALLDLQAMNKKCVDLIEALPSDKLTWRPSPDTRSFAEVFLHVAGERYQILSLMGAAAPAGFKAAEYEKSTTDKDRIVEDMNQSWDFTNKAINGMSNADFAKLLPKLGPQANEGDVVYMLVVDAHEHLGQLVAYARQNGIVPPWTAEANKNKANAAASK